MAELARASAALRDACAAALRAEPELAGVRVHGVAPAGARPPFVVVGPDAATRRLWAGGGGSEHRLQLNLWLAEGAEPAAMMAAVERAVAAARGEHGAFRIASAAVVRTTAKTSPAGWIQGVADVRALLEETGHGG